MKNYLETKNKEQCFGCRACEKICPKKCIEMKEDKEGFLYPDIDKEKCISCNMCIKVCPYAQKEKEEKKCNPEVYAVQIKDKEILMNSSSGGVFSVLANYVLDNKGIVFGAAFNEENIVEHIGIVDKERLYLLRGSKYVQSDTKNTYCEVKRMVEDKKLILYTGTPCQIDGLRRFLGKEYENLITVDIICHGVPSKKFFKKYIDYMNKKYNSKKIDFEFRDKTINGWSHTLRCTIKKAKKEKMKYYTPQTSSYYYAFINALNYRETCYRCPYASEKRPSDITIGDFWNLESKKKEKFNTRNGVSVMILNSKTGKIIFENIKNKMYYEKSSIEEAKKGNVQLSNPVERNSIRDNIYKILEEENYNKLEKKYLRSNKYYKYKIRSFIGINLKRIIKNKKR